MTTAKEKAIQYTDKLLAEIDPILARQEYSRHTKMGITIFTGSYIEQTYEDGYKQAIEDIKKQATLLVTEKQIGQ